MTTYFVWRKCIHNMSILSNTQERFTKLYLRDSSKLQNQSQYSDQKIKLLWYQYLAIKRILSQY